MTYIKLASLHAADGTKIRKTPTSSYPNIYKFNSGIHEIKNIAGLHQTIQDIASTGGCLLKGTLNRPLVAQSRAGSTSSEDTTNWICLDLDGADYDSPEAFIQSMPEILHNTSYVTQYSSSHGIKPGLRCHIFMLLSTPMYPGVLKQLLYKWNYHTPILKKGLSLTASNMALSYPLDVTVCQNDKLIYVAPMKGKRMSKNNFQLVLKKQTMVDLTNVFVSPEQNKSDQKLIINELRKEKGMTARKQLTLKTIGKIEIMTSPDEAVVTGIKQSDRFVYLNLNGGDSWAYYHPLGNPEFIHNFKGEPSYKTAELIPAYNKTAHRDEKDDVNSKQYFAILDKATTVYVMGYYEPALDKITIEIESRSITHVNHYMAEHGQPEPDPVPSWDVIHDFNSKDVYNPTKKIINQYRMSTFMENAVPGSMGTRTKLLINHVLNYDKDVVEHFLNWLAVIVQHRQQTKSAWIIHGTQGTGKGVLYKLLSRIIGDSYTSSIMLHDVERDYNGFLRNSLLTIIDEAQISSTRNPAAVIEKIKHFITDSPIFINEKNKKEHPVINSTSVILFSNQHDPAKVDSVDRRFNIAARQEKPLLKVMTSEEIDLMYSEEIQMLANYLMHCKADIYKASCIIDTDARKTLQDTTRTSNEQTADALRTGDFNFFVENIPDSDFYVASLKEPGMLSDAAEKLPTYKDILQRMYDSVDKTPLVLDRYDLAVLFYAISQTHCKTKNKFGRFMNTMHLPLIPTRSTAGTVRALPGIKFKASSQQKANYLKIHKQDKQPRVIK